VELTPSEASLVLEHQETLARMGIETESFGGSTVLVRGYPAMLGGVDPGELLRQLAIQLAQGERVLERRDVLDELLHMLACKGAVKAGDPLSRAEVDALLEYRHVVQDSHHCPHGRPTTLVFTREELDRRFKRI
jgi:DNA mismatch repair protein MutL